MKTTSETTTPLLLAALCAAVMALPATSAPVAAAIAPVTAVDAAPPAEAAAPTGLAVYAAPARAMQEAPEADSLYRAGREALNRGAYPHAASLFALLVEDHPTSARAPDALYWRAFALYRAGGEQRLRTALAALDRHASEYPDAGTREDARALRTRIQGQLAAMGDAEAAASVAEGAAVAAGAAGDAEERMAEVRAEAEARTESDTETDVSIQESCPETDENDIQTAALNALLQMDSDRALPILEKVLARRGPCTADLRRRALFLVSQQEGPDTEEILLEVARSDPDAEVREQAVFWLSQVESERAVDILEQILAEHPEPALQEKAVFALSQHDHPRAGEILRAYAGDGAHPEEIRKKAIFWLGQRDGGAGFLRNLYASLASADLREQVISAMGQSDEPEHVDWLLERAGDAGESTELRKKALFWASQAGVSGDQLGPLYDRFEDPELRQQVIFALSQLDDGEGVEPLIRIARNETDTELRKKAIFWLGQSDDPRAAEFLLQVIESGTTDESGGP